MSDKQRRLDWVVRFGGLLTVALAGFLLAACGLSLSFARYRLSAFFFFATILLLIVIRLVVWRLKRRPAGRNHLSG